jgi:hypothetical protein
VLIKVVLESQLSIGWLWKVFQLRFSTGLDNWSSPFLWSGSKEKQNYHLCSWETIARPKNCGGWGLRNIHLVLQGVVDKHSMESLDEEWHLASGH